jgi:hypothetical protein
MGQIHDGRLAGSPVLDEGEAGVCRTIELETDRFRLQRLVSELLIKNQHLRESLERMTALFGAPVVSSNADEQWS